MSAELPQQTGLNTLDYNVPGLAGDEVRGADGEIKPHWAYLLDSLKSITPEALDERQQKAMRLLRDDGASYNVYTDDINPARIWGLDLVPNIIGSDEWGDIESGLLERAELLNLLLRDLYGPRQLIRTGVIPPEGLFAHRGFLRACHGIKMPGDHELIVHAVDMIRREDGSMLVLSDRTQAPSGMGYALENRTVMSRVFPSLFRDSHVHRLAAFFQQLRAKLISLCPHQSRPRIAVLTPGPRNETYFEHAYLANYLGFYLVQSDDLVVRNGFLWMKSLDGLNRVDVLLRRVDDWFCDPVELRSDSRLGVAGLLDVVRSGNLVVANPLGSGVLENPVLMKYLPAISKALLGRELRLPSVETWWCGERKDREYVLTHLEQLVVKPTFRMTGQFAVSGAHATKEQLAELKARIEAEPMQYIAQPLLPSSYLPTLKDQSLQPRPAILRSYAIAGTGSYSIMPGGLTRVGLEDDQFIISSQTGASSKDTWVVASEPEREVSNLPSGDEQTARDTDLVNLPSRVLENLFWLGRYAERAEAALRILRTSYSFLNGEEPLTPELRAYLLQVIAEATSTPVMNVPPTDSDMTRQLLEGPVHNAIGNMLNSMLFCADEAKELLTSDTYRVINDIRDTIPALSISQPSGMMSPEDVLNPLVTALMALSGLSHESMVRGYGWRFLEIGRRLERAMQSAALISGLLGPVLPEPEQSRITEALLLIMEGLISYRRRHGARIALQTGLDLVLLDPSNPRSIMYQLEKMQVQLREMPNKKTYLHELPAVERVLVEALSRIRLLSLSETCADDSGARKKLKVTMQEQKAAMIQISNLISDRYFDHREQSQQLVSGQWEGL
ncbi:MAG: hypothetical protein CMI00_03935 [Oceanospirillaceae bacterium]|nr:hypothetical protein [Oceanospirillaceae bacterium]|tara:strand:- start:1420 stop:3948 length:2529 start_codon:yes stop_codon:yes gene_type:complete